MKSERILALDVSSKTGYACMASSDSGIKLEEHGTLNKIDNPGGDYPSDYVIWAHNVFNEIHGLISRLKPDILAIEETVAGSKAVYSQKFLEWCHFLLASFIKEHKVRATYLLTGAWRSEVGAKMTKEESDHNKAVKKYKVKNNTKVARDINGKRIGKKTKKHINIRRANEIFGAFLREPLKKKNEDEADALLLGYALHLRRTKNSGTTEEVSMEQILKGEA
jgi:Holliday junction resolvasome RuvABC endonuclease subunit